MRVLLATDVLSEGQNLQDCAIVVNYDLPWAIIRLIQRAGRVDRIGQKADKILCYSFLPADGVERIIRLRARVRQRLKENAEVVGTDEAFFEDDPDHQVFRDLFTEKAGILDGDVDTEVDLASYAYQIWKNAISADPSCRRPSPTCRPWSFCDQAPSAHRERADRGAGLHADRGRDRRLGVDEQSWHQRDRVAVCHSQSCRMHARNAGARCAKTTITPWWKRPSI